MFILDTEEAPGDEVINPIRKALKLLLSLCYITHLSGGVFIIFIINALGPQN